MATIVAAAGGSGSSAAAAYRVDSYGVKGDWSGGVGGSGTNDTAAVQALINQAPAGATIQFTSGKTYRLDNVVSSKSLVIDGNGASIVCNPTLGTAPLFWFAGTLGASKTITSPAEGATSVTCSTVADAGTFAAGDYVVIEDRAALLKFDGTTSIHTDGRSEINRVLTADAATGIVTLESALEWPYSTSPRISKATMIDRPQVRGFASIVEIDPGAWAGALHGAVPHLVHFTYCVAPRAEQIVASRWNLHIVNFYRCLAPVVSGVTGRDPIRPATGGHGYLMRFDECLAGLARDSIGHGVRHLVNWVGSYDCTSQNNVCHNPQTAGYQTHGIFNKRARSVGDAAYGGVNGWSFGNPQFAADLDMVIERPRCVSAGTAILARSKCQRLTIVDPDLHIAGTARGVHVCEGAGRVTIRGGTLEALSTGNQVLVRSRLGNSDTLVASPTDITIDGTRMIGGTQTLLLDSIGDIEIRNVVFDTPAMGSTAAALIGIGTSEGLTPTGVRVTGVIAATGAYQNAVQVGTTPTGRYDLTALRLTAGALTAPAATNLRMADVRATTLTLSGDVLAAKAGGARISGNTPSAYDADAAQDPAFVATIDPRLVTGSATWTTANQARGVRVVMPRSGTLHDVAIWIVTASGNVDVGIYDTTATTRARLWSTGSITCPTAGAWAIVGDPAVSVVAGQQLDFVLAADNTTIAVPRVGAGGNWTDLPTSFLPVAGGGRPSLSWSRATSLPLPSTAAESGLSVGTTVPLIIARIA